MNTTPSPTPAPMTHAKRAVLASAFIFPGAGLILLGQRLRGCIFVLPAAAIIGLLLVNLFQVAMQLSDELKAKAAHGDLQIDLSYLWHNLHNAFFSSPYWEQGKWLLLAAWLFSIISSYAVGKKLDLARSNASST